MPPVIRPIEQADLAEVAAFHRRTIVHAYAGIFPADAPPPTVDDLHDEWASETGAAWVAVDGAVIGTVIARGSEIRRLLVAPERWGGGLGRRLLEIAQAHVAASGHTTAALWVLEENERARRFYEASGWTLEPGELLHPSGVREVRYLLDLPATPSGA